MNDANYMGWRPCGSPQAVFFDGTNAHLLAAVVSDDGRTDPATIDWGRRCEEAVNLSRMILWHSTWDHDVVADLAEMFANSMTFHFADHWQISREAVRNWVQHHQVYRSMMHGKDPLRKCPGCG